MKKFTSYFNLITKMLSDQTIKLRKLFLESIKIKSENKTLCFPDASLMFFDFSVCLLIFYKITFADYF